MKAFGLCLICCLLSLNSIAADRNSLREKLNTLDPGCAIALNDEFGKSLFSYNSEKGMIPASIIKIIVAQAAFDLLGKEYRFKTEFFRNQHQSIAIKGWGDPYLISEEISLITDHLQHKNLTRIQDIRLDASAFSKEVLIPGTSNTLNPYDALNGALVVNFNTLFVGRTKSGEVFSAEDITPLTPLAIEKSKFIRPGKKERINLTKNPDESLEYVGQLFSAFFVTAGIPVESEKILNTAIENDKWDLYYRHYSSRSLESIFEGLMKYSNNFIANQVFLVIGAEKMGYPASLVKSRMVLKNYLQTKWGFGENEIMFDEASGISKLNKITASQMMLILETFRESSDLLSGKNNLKIKSGTLTGVYNYAGYINTETGLRPFVIMTENKINRRDMLLKLLKEFSRDTASLPGKI